MAPEQSTECDVTVGYDADMQAASWSCTCGASEVIGHARRGTGERVARRLARLYAERHLNGDDAKDGAQ